MARFVVAAFVVWGALTASGLSEAVAREAAAPGYNEASVRRFGDDESSALGLRAMATAVVPMGATKMSAPEPHYLYPHIDVFAGF